VSFERPIKRGAGLVEPHYYGNQTIAIARLEHLVEMLRAKSIGEFAGLVPKVMVFS
jgi:hypothetical protein